MNNQVKLIDQAKLLEWLEDQKENSTMLYESIILSKIERAVLDGKFVPTIKPGDTHDCPKCGEKNCFDTPLAESTALRFVWCSFCNQFSYKEDWR